MTDIATLPDLDDPALSPCERRTIRAAARLKPPGRELAAGDVARRLGEPYETVRDRISQLRQRGLWPWPKPCVANIPERDPDQDAIEALRREHAAKQASVRDERPTWHARQQQRPSDRDDVATYLREWRKSKRGA